MALAIILLSGLLLLPNLASATVTWEGTSGVKSIIEGSGGCSGCHSTSTPEACSSAGSYLWYDIDSDTVKYNSANSCRSAIQDKTDYSSDTTWGDHMPSSSTCDPFNHYAGGATTAGCLSSSDANLIQSWTGTRYAAPTVTTTSMTAGFKDNNSATFRGSVDPNGRTVTSTVFNYGVGVSVGSTQAVTGPPDSGGNNAATSISGTVSNLFCGTGYSFRARATNASGSTNGTTRTFTTDACSSPTISFTGSGNAPGNRVSVSKNLTFDETSIAPISATDPDTGSLSWSINQASTNGTVVLDSASPLQFTYTAPSSSGLDSFILVVTDTDSAGDPVSNNSNQVTVYVNVTDNAPQFRQSLPAGTVITSDSLTVLENDGASPGQSITMFVTDADGDSISWSVASAPSNGTLGSFTTTSPDAEPSTNSITYTPNIDFDTVDTFTIRVTDGVTNVDLDVTANVTPVPDNPVANDDGPITFDIGVTTGPISVLANDTDVDTGDTRTINSISGLVGTNSAVAITGNTQIEYTSSMTQFTSNTFNYDIIDSDGLISNTAMVTMAPRDTDSDGVIDYLDNCPATSNAGQADNDGDQVINVNSTTDPGGSLGGDACDLDDDNDGMPDTYELANSLDPFDPTDVNGDNDGDGISNFDEFTNGTNPNLADLIIDATGYFTPFELTPPEPKSVHLFATAVTPIFESMLTDSTDPNGPYRPGINDIRWVPSNGTESRLDLNDSGNLLQTPPVQTLRIRPIVSFAIDQQVAEGGTASVRITLNGVSPSWPGTDVTVNYSVSGTASNPADHDAVGGTVTFVDQDFSETITVNTVADGIADPNETIVFTIDSASNAAIGVQRTHRVTIVEGNVAPAGALTFDQGGPPLSTAYLNVSNVVDITVNATDQNVGQTLSYDWSATDNALTPPLDSVTTNWTTTALATGNYMVDVVVTDDGSPALSRRISRVLKVEATSPALGGGDTDGDGTIDSTEGYGDSDGDGIPDYLDAQDGALGGSNLVPDQTVNMTSSHLLESTPGTTLTRGLSAEAAGRFGALVTDDDIEQFGGTGGTAPLNGDDSLEHATGVYDFEVHGLVPGASAKIVIPLQTAIPKNAIYRKFDSVSGWTDFVLNGNNRIASAVGAKGACPEPGSSLYRSGLNYLDNCIQLTIQDGGPNDSDNAANGVVADPGTTGITLSDPEIDKVEDGGGRMSPLLLAVFVLLGMMAIGRRQKEAA